MTSARQVQEEKSVCLLIPAYAVVLDMVLHKVFEAVGLGGVGMGLLGTRASTIANLVLLDLSVPSGFGLLCCFGV